MSNSEQIPYKKSHNFEIISLLMSLGLRPSLWIAHEENGPKPTTLTQCGLVGTNDCKCSRDQQLNVPFEARRCSRK
jgi:hypothetical protein